MKLSTIITILILLLSSCSNETSNKKTETIASTEPEVILSSGESKGNRFFTDMAGDTLFDGKTFYDIGEFKRGYCTVWQMLDGVKKCGVINTKGEEIIPITFEGDIGNYFKGYFALSVQEGRKEGVMDSTGKIIIPPIYDDYVGIQNGKVIVKNKFKWGVLSTNGGILTPLKYDHIAWWNNDRALVKIRDKKTHKSKYGFINERGELVVDTKYDLAYNFENGISLVERNSKIGFIDKEGNIVIDFIYDGYKEITDVHNDILNEKGYGSKMNARFMTEEGNIIVKSNTGWGYIDANGKEIIPCELEYIGLPKGKGVSKYLVVSKEGKTGKYSFEEKKINWLK